MKPMKSLIDVNKYVNGEIESLEKAIVDFKVKTDKDKANFGNLCTCLTGFRLVEKATAALLANDNIVITDDGEYYQKIDEVDNNEDEEPSKSNSEE